MSVYHYDNARAARRMIGFILFIIGLALTVALYFVKTKAQTARAEMRSLERQIVIERAALDVLRAEAAHMASPARLHDLASTTLALSPATVDQRINFADLDTIAPIIDLQVESEPESEPEP